MVQVDLLEVSEVLLNHVENHFAEFFEFLFTKREESGRIKFAILGYFFKLNECVLIFVVNIYFEQGFLY